MKRCERAGRCGLGLGDPGLLCRAVTLSGGEPLMQDRFAARLFAAVKTMGVHTAIETNGFNGSKLTDAELANVAANKAAIAEQEVRLNNVGDLVAAGRAKGFFKVGRDDISTEGKLELQGIAAQAKTIASGDRLAVVGLQSASIGGPMRSTDGPSDLRLLHCD